MTILFSFFSNFEVGNTEHFLCHLTYLWHCVLSHVLLCTCSMMHIIMHCISSEGVILSGSLILFGVVTAYRSPIQFLGLGFADSFLSSLMSGSIVELATYLSNAQFGKLRYVKCIHCRNLWKLMSYCEFIVYQHSVVCCSQMWMCTDIENAAILLM
jgi:hypothetical protein